MEHSAPEASQMSAGQWRFHKVRRAARDCRDTRRIDLGDLRCLLVSDATQRLASFSLCVSCGLADGREIAALQEAVRTSERFARFEDFIKLNNGAVYPPDVRVDHTVYGFEVHQSALTLAAVKFAEVIAAGELGCVAGRRASFTNIYARNSENEVLAGLLGAAHPFSKLLTLFQQQSANLPDTGLDEHFTSFYNAAHSSLALSGNQSVDELATIADKFARIFPSVRSSPISDTAITVSRNESRAIQTVQPQATVFPRDALHKLVIVNSDVLSKFVVTWPLSTETLGGYRCKPLHFVSHLLQQNRPGGLFDQLKREGLVNDIQIIIPENELETNRHWKLYRAVFMVTTLGIERRLDILTALLHYLMHVQASEIQRWIYEEAAIAWRLKYEFAEVAVHSRVASMSIAVQRFDPEDCLLGDRTMVAYDEQCIRQTISELLHGSYSVILEGDFDVASFPEVSSEKDFGLVADLPDIDLNSVTKFSAYTRNALMPQRLDIQQELIYLEDYPNVIEKGNSYRLWYQFKSAGLPKNYCFVHIFSDLMRSPEGFTRAEVVCSALERLLCNRDSADAGFEFSASTKTSGISLTIVGFNDKFPVFLNQVISLIADFKITPELFQECHDAVLESYQFRGSNAAYAESVFSQIYSGQLDLRQCRTAAGAIQLKSVQQVFADVRNSSYTECFMYGNCTAQDATGLVSIIKTITSTDHVTRPIPYCLQMDRLHSERCPAVQTDQSDDSTTILYYHQNADGHNGAEVLIDILVHLLERQLHFQEALICYLPRSCGGDTTGFTVEVTSRPDIVTRMVTAVEKAIPQTITSLVDSSELESLLKSTKADLRRRRGVARYHCNGSASHYQISEPSGCQMTMTDEASALFEEIREQRFRFGASTLYGELLQCLEAEDFRAWLRETLDIGWLREPLCRIQIE